MIVVLFRTTLFFVLTVLSLRLMGKRQIGELEPTELVVTILISDIATLCLQDVDLPVLYAVVPIVALVIYELLASALSLTCLPFREFLSGSYSVIIDNGKLDQKEMRRAELTLDEILEEIRQAGGVSLDEVRFCILETSGQMSVMLKKDVSVVSLPVVLISDGKIIKKNMKKEGISRETLGGLLRQNGVTSPRDVFWLALEDGKVSFVRKRK